MSIEAATNLCITWGVALRQIYDCLGINSPCSISRFLSFLAMFTFALTHYLRAAKIIVSFDSDLRLQYGKFFQGRSMMKVAGYSTVLAVCLWAATLKATLCFGGR